MRVKNFLPHGEVNSRDWDIATLRRMFNTTRDETIIAYVDRVFVGRLNNEREELMRLVMEMDVEENEPSIRSAGARLGPTGAATAAISACKRQFAHLMQERVQNHNEDESRDP